MLVPKDRQSKAARPLPPSRNARLPATIVYGRTKRPCVVKSTTAREVRIEVVPVGEVPNSFDLVIPGEGAHHCRVVWRALKEIGVTYVN